MNNNKSQFFSTRKDIKKWLDKYHIKNYTINDDLSVDVNGDVNISDKNLEIIPIKFGIIAGGFWCTYNKLINLFGAPEYVGGHFNCSHNQLITLDGSPKSVGGSFWCRNNQLVNLVGGPKTTGGDFCCQNNSLNSLFEIINCDFKGKIYFNITKKNFKKLEQFSILKKYYNKAHECYMLTTEEFCDTIKPHIEKENLQEKLQNKERVGDKFKTPFL